MGINRTNTPGFLFRIDGKALEYLEAFKTFPARISFLTFRLRKMNYQTWLLGNVLELPGLTTISEAGDITLEVSQKILETA